MCYHATQADVFMSGRTRRIVQWSTANGCQLWDTRIALLMGICRYRRPCSRCPGWFNVTVTRAQLDRRPADVSAMFDRLAERYDLLNDALSLGQDRRWRKAVARAVHAGPGEVVLDLAAGTGTSARACAAAGARAVACDFSLG